MFMIFGTLFTIHFRIMRHYTDTTHYPLTMELTIAPVLPIN